MATILRPSAADSLRVRRDLGHDVSDPVPHPRAPCRTDAARAPPPHRSARPLPRPALAAARPRARRWSPGGNSKPARPSIQDFRHGAGTRPRSPAAARASPRPACGRTAPASVEGCTTASTMRIDAGTSSRWPRKRTRSVTPSSLASATQRSRIVLLAEQRAARRRCTPTSGNSAKRTQCDVLAFPRRQPAEHAEHERLRQLEHRRRGALAEGGTSSIPFGTTRSQCSPGRPRATNASAAACDGTITRAAKRLAKPHRQADLPAAKMLRRENVVQVPDQRPPRRGARPARRRRTPSASWRKRCRMPRAERSQPGPFAPGRLDAAAHAAGCGRA